MDTVRVTIHEEDAERLGVEREAEYRPYRSGDSFFDSSGRLVTGIVDSCTRRLVVKKKPKTVAEQLNEIGWEPGVRDAVLRIWPNGDVYVVRNGSFAARLAVKSPVPVKQIENVFVGYNGVFTV